MQSNLNANKKLRNKIILLLLFGIFLVEGAVRLSGITDFPLYDADNKIGYIPKASQSGSFLNSHDWQFNALHMGASEFKPNEKIDTLLVGDSIVLGGNPLKQQDRLGPQLKQVIGGNVWPISAGSWGLRNELMYLKQNPQVVANVDQIIFVLNGGDFDIASSWACETTHPRTKPLLATLYVVKKYVYDWQKCSDVLPEYKVADGDWSDELAAFINQSSMQNKKVHFFLYPAKTEEANGELLKHLEKFSTKIHKITPAPIYSVARDSRWSLDMYRDGIHPSAKGNKLLAQIISKPEVHSAL